MVRIYLHIKIMFAFFPLLFFLQIYLFYKTNVTLFLFVCSKWPSKFLPIPTEKNIKIHQFKKIKEPLDIFI